MSLQKVGSTAPRGGSGRGEGKPVCHAMQPVHPGWCGPGVLPAFHVIQTDSFPLLFKPVKVRFPGARQQKPLNLQSVLSREAKCQSQKRDNPRCKLQRSGGGPKPLKGGNHLRGAEKVGGWLREPQC